MAFLFPFSEGSEPIEGRFSFSLSTFAPSGQLGQVERAVLASSLGIPIVAVVQEDRIVMAAPQILPSPFMQDDGTSRFAAVTPQIAMGHTGIAADGRVLMAAAQRLAVEHAYTYDENIPIDLLLEEVSLLFQEYTMKEGARPFGATLLVAYVPEEDNEDGDTKARLFRVDPSGSVMRFDEGVAILNGQSIRPSDRLEEALLSLASAKPSKSSAKETRKTIATILQSELGTNIMPKPSSSYKKGDKEDPKMNLPSSIIAASLSSTEDLTIERTPLSSFLDAQTEN